MRNHFGLRLRGDPLGLHDRFGLRLRGDPFGLRDRFANPFHRHRTLFNNRSNRFECFDFRFKLELALTISLDCRFQSRPAAKSTVWPAERHYCAAQCRLGCLQFKRDLTRSATQSRHNFHFSGSRSGIFHTFQLRTGCRRGPAETWEMNSAATNFVYDEHNEANSSQNENCRN